MSRTDRLERMRGRALLGFLVLWAAWWSLTAAGEHLSLPDAVAGSVAVVGAVLGIGWVFTHLRLLAVSRAISEEPSAAVALNDERVRNLRVAAMAWAFGVLVATMAALLVVSLIHPFSGELAARIGLLVAVPAAGFRYLYLENRDGIDLPPEVEGNG